ncbi:uncharacterized protein LOC132031679 [Lycium ferocissimum]|uniref:uncharacterized protein LOC132031679 n=1 Tax=Lycium ferocissimum TaxID=112874 RepID=UPI002814FA2D|nr:uncharacterized protein LOC132031679 [Lycium ferocissimum]
MPSVPKIIRRKEASESKKTGKLSKRGVEMTCSKCHTPGHNKRKCLRDPATAGPSATASAGPSATASAGPSATASAGPSSVASAGPSATASASAGPSSSSGPRKAPAPTGRGRGRPKGSTEKPGLPSERVRSIKSSAVVTGELQHKASGGVKWQGRQAMTSRDFNKEGTKSESQTRLKPYK